MSLESPFATAIERGAYSAIVYKDGDLIVAKDIVGGVIKENTDASTTIQAAINAGGKIFIAHGTYTIVTSLEITADNVFILGENRKTILSAGTSDMKIIKPHGDFNTISALKLYDGHIYVDDNAIAADEGIVVDNCEIEDGYVHIREGRSNSSYINNYIHGASEGINIYANHQAYENVIIANNRIEETGDDAIAAIGHGYQGRNISITGNVIKNAAKTTGGAGIKLDAGDSYIGGITTALENIAVTGNSIYSTDTPVGERSGIRVLKFPTYVSIVSNTMHGTMAYGIWAAQNRAVVSSNHIHLSGVGEGISLQWVDYGNILSGNFIKCETKAGSIGIRLHGRAHRVIMDGNLIHHVEKAMSEDGSSSLFSGVMLLNNMFWDVTTPVTVIDALSIVSHNLGYVTENTVLSNTFAIDSTGVKTVTIAHGLAVTPALDDCYLTVVEDTNVDDWAFDLLKVEAVGPTNVAAKIHVSTASATGSATAKLALRVGKL